MILINKRCIHKKQDKNIRITGVWYLVSRHQAPDTRHQTPGTQYDCLIYIANWPEPRQTAWDVLLRARAVENLCYVIGVNRVKQDGNGINYAGGSAVIDHKGEQLLYKLKHEFVKTITLDKKEIISYREKFPAHLDGDEFEIKN